MPSKKRPIKMVWFEHVTDWLAGGPESRPPSLPKGVSRPGMTSVLGMILRATRSETNEAVVSARWVESMTGVNRGSVLRALAFLEAYQWLSWTQRRRNRVKVYEICIPSPDISSFLSGNEYSPPDASGDTSGDTSGDRYSHTPGTPGTPLEERTKDRTDALCSNCGDFHGHDPDCAFREF